MPNIEITNHNNRRSVQNVRFALRLPKVAALVAGLTFLAAAALRAQTVSDPPIDNAGQRQSSGKGQNAAAQQSAASKDIAGKEVKS